MSAAGHDKPDDPYIATAHTVAAPLRPSAIVHRLYRRRYGLVGIYVALLTIGWELLPRIFGDTSIDLLWWWGQDASNWGALLLFVLLPLFVPQCLLLLGAPHFRWPRPTGRRSMRLSIIGGAFMAGLLSLGILAALGSWSGLWEPFWNWLGDRLPHQPEAYHMPWFVYAVVGVFWLLWLGIFSLIWTGQWVRRFRNIYRLIIAGTILELLITVPIDVRIRKQTSCYCGEGSFYALWFGLLAIFWCFGPGVILLFQYRAIQRRAPLQVCTVCGYDLRASKDRCPECGTPFTRTPRQRISEAAGTARPTT